MILTTERLQLREVEDSDWHVVFAYQSDSRYQRFESPKYDLQKDVQRLMREFIHWQHEQPRRKFQLAITLRADCTLIGTCGIRKVRVNAREAELGYELNPNFWGQGYATEAARAMLTFGFETLHLQRVWAQCIAENEASARVMERIGMCQERRMLKHTWMQDQWWDMLRYGISHTTWQFQTMRDLDA
jgi:[ribosomal protein S5]-alanine N-acetyltransferase